MMNSNANIPFQGRCLCGAIQYQVDCIEPNMAHCHCSMCRKFHGAAFATFGESLIENFHWIAGEKLLKSYTANNGTVRQFCDNCGSSMTFSTPLMPGVIEFSLGTLDTDPRLKPDAHIYVASKADWYDICDSLPQHRTSRK